MARQQVIETILDLRRRGNRLFSLADQLADEYDIQPTDLGNGKPTVTTTVTVQSDQVSSNGSDARAERGDRIEQLKAFFRLHGPHRRKDIPEKSGIPIGTVNHLLKRDDFCQYEGSRWGVPDQPETPEEPE